MQDTMVRKFYRAVKDPLSYVYFVMAGLIDATDPELESALQWEREHSCSEPRRVGPTYGAPSYWLFTSAFRVFSAWFRTVLHYTSAVTERILYGKSARATTDVKTQVQVIPRKFPAIKAKIT